LDLGQTRLEQLDPIAEQPTVGFELLFARTTQADATLLALEVGPAPHQARGQMFELGELHLQLAFVAARALGKDVEDERGAVDDHALQLALEVALLAWRQRVIEDHDVGAVRTQCLADLLNLAAASEKLGVGRGALAMHHGFDAGAGPERKQLELRQALLDRALTEVELDENRTLSGGGTFKHGRPRGPTLAGPERCSAASVAALFLLDDDGARRHDGRDRVLVNHLRHGVLEQHDVLIERFDLALQLDAVDQVDRYGDVFASQRVEEGVLSKLPFI